MSEPLLIQRLNNLNIALKTYRTSVSTILVSSGAVLAYSWYQSILVQRPESLSSYPIVGLLALIAGFLYGVLPSEKIAALKFWHAGMLHGFLAVRDQRWLEDIAEEHPKAETVVKPLLDHAHPIPMMDLPDIWKRIEVAAIR